MTSVPLYEKVELRAIKGEVLARVVNPSSMGRDNIRVRCGMRAERNETGERKLTAVKRKRIDLIILLPPPTTEQERCIPLTSHYRFKARRRDLHAPT